MKKFFCMACDYIWDDLDHEGCPECGSREVADGGETADLGGLADFEHGHFEGDLFSSGPKSLGYHQDDTGE